ncbi:MAG TPA: flagellar protein FlaG [Desulfobacterales bacterium]|nr:flagellar protein FlaG [Desulfobacterales bacterium]
MMVENVTAIKTQNPTANTTRVAVSDMPPKPTEAEQKAEPEIEVSQDMLDGVQHDIRMMRDVGLHFSVHETTGRTVVRVVDKETEKLVREIPPEEFLNLAAKLEEMIGIIFDKKV